MPNMKRLIDFFGQALHPDLAEKFKDQSHLTVSGAGNFSSKAFLLGDLLRKPPKEIFPILWIVNDKEEQENALRALQAWSGLPVHRFEMRENEQAHTGITNENRLSLLRTLRVFLEKEPTVVIAPYINFLQETPDPRDLEKNIFTLKKHETIPLVRVFEKLISIGYEVSKDQYLTPGQYRGDGAVLTLFPANEPHPYRLEFEFDKIVEMFMFDQDAGEVMENTSKLSIYPLNLPRPAKHFFSYLPENILVVEDELEVPDEFFEMWDETLKQRKNKGRTIQFTAFPEDSLNHTSLRYLSVLKYQNFIDLALDVREKNLTGWNVVCFTKHTEEMKAVFDERKIRYLETEEPFDIRQGGADGKAPTRIMNIPKEDAAPHAFQNGELKILVVSDHEIINLHEEEREKSASQKVFWEFLSSLKPGDLVVHIDHGVARFLGLEKREISGVTREYMQLGYAENDKLFVPIDQADKVNKYIGAQEEAPKLSRLGSAEWSTITRKIRKETEEIAKELLGLYAKRKQVGGFKFGPDTASQLSFEKTFPYEETPGQIKAIVDTKKDMEREIPMDRLICGDVGFGKTEIAMRAAFKAVQNKKQVALVSPITILADQHYRSFQKRMDPFHVRVEMLSRFKTPREQKETLARLEKGEVDIIIGTHRLLQKDVKFKDLGLVVVDEEQRFGVKQKEKFKQLRTEIDILTLTATPIPRTLNICLNKLRDITTITTPPPGRLPVITEVRRYSNDLIREAILREMKRGGQVYFLHNRVQSIDSIAQRLRNLIPEARLEVAHGKMLSKELEKRIIDFKDHKFDVLVSSAIIENGIDLSNANTLIVNNAEKFGLAQLYQLRGRVGRGKQQAFAYFLYQSQRLRIDAKKRLRAIVEASELGAGFQIAMKDLEIRGAGNILGVNQHGVINVVGVSHFIRMLNQAVEDLQSGKTTETTQAPQEAAIELPVNAYIPDFYISNTKEKINTYQRMSSADNLEYLEELRNDILESFGKLPKEVMNLFRVIELKILAKQAGLTLIKAENVHMKEGKQILLYMSPRVKPENIAHLLEYNSHFEITGTKLRIKIEHLGLQWMDELRECVKKLSEKVEMPGMVAGK